MSKNRALKRDFLLLMRRFDRARILGEDSISNSPSDLAPVLKSNVEDVQSKGMSLCNTLVPYEDLSSKELLYIKSIDRDYSRRNSYLPLLQSFGDFMEGEHTLKDNFMDSHTHESRNGKFSDVESYETICYRTSDPCLLICHEPPISILNITSTEEP